MSSFTKPVIQDLVAEAEMEKLVRDLENIELMNLWGKEDSERARQQTAAARRTQPHRPRPPHAQ